MENEGKTLRGIRLTDEAWDLSEKAAKKLGVKRSAILEIAIRDFAAKMGVREDAGGEVLPSVK